MARVGLHSLVLRHPVEATRELEVMRAGMDPASHGPPAINQYVARMSTVAFGVPEGG